MPIHGAFGFLSLFLTTAMFVTTYMVVIPSALVDGKCRRDGLFRTTPILAPRVPHVWVGVPIGRVTASHVRYRRRYVYLGQIPIRLI